MDIKCFALQEWIEQDLIILFDIESTNNCADVLTKQVGKILHHKHYDILMGKRPPEYYGGTYKV